MRRALALALCPLLASPAVAQDRQTIDLVALLIAGIADGASTNANGPAPVTRLAEGHYVVTPDTGASLTFKVAEPEPCIFTVKLDSSDPVTIHVNANLLKSLTVLLVEAENGLFAYRLMLSGDPEKLMIETKDRTFPPPSDAWPFITSLELVAVKEAAADFRKACPGPAP